MTPTEQIHRERLKSLVGLVKWSLLTGLLLVATLGALRIFSFVKEHGEYARHHKRAYSAIDGLRHRRPTDVEQLVWDDLVDRTLTAYANTCFSKEHVSNLEMRKFDSDLQVKLNEVVGPRQLVWIWDRLEKTGPHGEKYMARFKPEFVDAVNAVEGAKRRRHS